MNKKQTILNSLIKKDNVYLDKIVEEAMNKFWERYGKAYLEKKLMRFLRTKEFIMNKKQTILNALIRKDSVYLDEIVDEVMNKFWKRYGKPYNESLDNDLRAETYEVFKNQGVPQSVDRYVNLMIYGVY